MIRETNTAPARFLFALWEGGGNLPPSLGVAQRLVRRGHAVRVMSDPCNEAEVRAAGCQFVPYEHAPHRHDKSAASTLITDWQARNAREAFVMLQDRLMFGPALDFARDVLRELDREPASAVAVNDVLYGAMIAAEKAHVPWAVLMPNCYLGSSRGFPLLGFRPLAGPIGAARDAVVMRLVAQAYARGLPALNAARTELGLGPIKHPFDQVARAARVLVLTSRAFDFPAAWLPPNVRYVGPQLDDPSWADPWRSPWPTDDQRPLVAVALSTTFQDQTKTVQRIIDALGQLPVQGLVTTGPALDPEQFRAPANVVVQPSAPHGQVFPQAAAVVTHAGHGTVIRALASGVPLLCVPMGRDQKDNANRVTVRGAGLQLGPAASVMEIRKAVQRLIQEPAFRQHARQLGKHIREEADRSTAVAELEALTLTQPVAFGTGK